MKYKLKPINLFERAPEPLEPQLAFIYAYGLAFQAKAFPGALCSWPPQSALATEQRLPACWNSSLCPYRDPGVSESLLDSEPFPAMSIRNCDESGGQKLRAEGVILTVLRPAFGVL